MWPVFMMSCSLCCAARASASREFVVDDKVLGQRRPPDVERVLGRVVPGGPLAAGFDEVDVERVLRIAAPGVAHVTEVVGAEHMTPDAPALRVAGLLHLARAEADRV